jgi:sulfur carrier protein
LVICQKTGERRLKNEISDFTLQTSYFILHFMSKQISLQVNGETRSCSSQTPLPDLLQQLGFNPRLVAVEYNGEILHRQFWSQTTVQPGDRLEVVTIVGGG